ncbi:MAG: DoxX family protein [Parcubacteria group bacterium]|nr:DoxX family protein [Parcubacteria group bacterium]MBI2049146.1 DoxX family protein [Parcubacteria group bacterium]
MNFSRLHNPDLALLTLRLFLGGIFLAHGAEKLLFFSVISGGLASAGFTAPDVILALIVSAEIAGGAAVLLGFFVEIGAALIALNVMASFLLFVFPQQGFSFTGIESGFIAFAFAMSVSLFFSGAGKWALGHHIRQGAISVGTLYKK